MPQLVGCNKVGVKSTRLRRLGRSKQHKTKKYAVFACQVIDRITFKQTYITYRFSRNDSQIILTTRLHDINTEYSISGGVLSPL